MIPFSIDGLQLLGNSCKHMDTGKAAVMPDTWVSEFKIRGNSGRIGSDGVHMVFDVDVFQN